MMTIRTLAAVAALACCLGACKDEPSSLDQVRAKKAKINAAQPVKKVIETPVPWGLKVACDKLLDKTKLSAALGNKDVTIEDKSKTEDDATSICQIKLAGTPPTADEQKKMWVKNARVLGVLPGDEICMVTMYCGFAFNAEEEKAKCQKQGLTVSTEVGEVTCLEKFEAGADYKYVFSALDPDTKCKIKVNPGPSVVDEATPKLCLKAAVDLIVPENLKN